MADQHELDRHFEALTGQTPFAWQRRLFARFLAGELPDAVDIPTGLGKTKVMALWLIARALGADLPRRLVYVVDRRAVVDQASAEAAGLAERVSGWLARLPEAGAGLRPRLGLARADDQLPVSTLRGQFVDNKLWLESPASAVIVVGTVDMIGSRLLFGGYGVGRGMRPAHAGLIGADALVVLDEAHLVLPFQALLEQVTEHAEHDRAASCPAGDCPIVPPLRLLTLSATGRTRPTAKLFSLQPEDEADPPAAARLKAEKRLRLLDEVAPGALADMLAERAFALAEGSRAVLVFCNSRRTAQLVAARLQAKPYGAERVALLVGERRLHERERLTDPETEEGAVFARFDPKRHARSGPDGEAEPAFLVATSAGEVGVDLDADDLVCDLVAWERMVQRFGRVNRRSVPGTARIEIVPVAGDKEAEDEIAAARLAELRAPFAHPAWAVGEDGTKDASPLALRRLKDRDGMADLLRRAESDEPLRPALTRPLIEAFATTSLAEHPGRPKLEPWLRGWVEAEPQTALAWRSLLPLRGDRAGNVGDDPATWQRDLAAWFEAAPPHLTELLEAPTWRVAEVLKKRADARRRAEQRRDAGAARGEAAAPPVVVVALDRRGEFEAVWTAEAISDSKLDPLVRLWSDRTLVVDARLGGLDKDGLLDPKADHPPVTLDGKAQGGWSETQLQAVGLRIRSGRREPSEGAWRLGDYVWREDPDADDGRELWTEVWRGAGATVGNAAIARQEQSLQEHQQRAAAVAARIARQLGLAEPYRSMLVAVAAGHDRGKDRKLWQDAMRAPATGRPYAKTKGGGNSKALGGYRHEFGSLADAASDPAILALPEDVRALALHLIAAHHGHARPAIAAIDPDAPPSATRARAQEAALRFAALQRRWGAWGLAWWEALLRAADWEASRELNEAPADG